MNYTSGSIRTSSAMCTVRKIKLELITLLQIEIRSYFSDSDMKKTTEMNLSLDSCTSVCMALKIFSPLTMKLKFRMTSVFMLPTFSALALNNRKHCLAVSLWLKSKLKTDLRQNIGIYIYIMQKIQQ